jgi:hypothetical protein
VAQRDHPGGGGGDDRRVGADDRGLQERQLDRAGLDVGLDELEAQRPVQGLWS